MSQRPPTPSAPEDPSPRWSGRAEALVAAIGITIALAFAAFAVFPSSSSQPAVPLAVDGSPPSTDQGTVTQNVVVVDSQDQDTQLAVGTWQDFYHGQRTLTLRPDGTATMVVELSGWKARLFTRRLELDIVWSIEDGKMHRRTVGGRPADKVEFVNKRSGVQVAEPIRSLTRDDMILVDQDGSRQYHWRRVR
jgi:hypothetical protein